MDSSRPKSVFRIHLVQSISVVLITLALLGCSKDPIRYDLPPQSRAETTKVIVGFEGSPDIVLPHNAVKGLVGGALVGILDDCVIWFCIPVLSSFYAIAGAMTAATPSSIDRVENAIEVSEVKAVIGTMLVEAIVEQGNELGTFTFVAATPDASQVEAYGGSLAGPAPSPATQRTIALVVEPITVGIAVDKLVLTIDGRLDEQKIEPIAYSSAGHELTHWTANNGANIRPALHDAVRSVASDLVKIVFRGEEVAK